MYGTYEKGRGAQPSFTMPIKAKNIDKKKKFKSKIKQILFGRHETFGPKSPRWSTTDQTAKLTSI